MDKDAEFKTKLNGVIEKYKEVLEEKDPNFLLEYINHCLSTDTVVSPKSYKTQQTKFSDRLASIFVKCIIIVFLITGCGISLKGYIDEKLKYMEENANDTLETYYLTEIRKWSVALGLPKYDTIKELYDSECAIKNPWYKAKPPTCLCNFNVRRYIVENPETAQENFKNSVSVGADPFIILNSLEYPVSYQDIRNVVMDNRYDFSLGHSFVSSVKGQSIRRDLDTLFAEEAPPQYSIVKWDLNFVEGIRHLRTLFPRPKFVPLNSEVNLGRSLYFFGEDAPLVIMKMSFGGMASSRAFYVQAWGRKEVYLKPKHGCKCGKSQLHFTLNQGQLLHFNEDMFDLFVGPANGYFKYAIGYVGFINMA